MSQADVRKVLEDKKEWLLSKEIAELLGSSLSSTSRCLSALFKTGEIEKQKAFEVIKEKKRLERSIIHAFAYKIKDRQTNIKNELEKIDIKNKTSESLRSLPLRK